MIGLTPDDEENGRLLNPISPCFMSHLKQIKIDDFVPSFEKIHVVKQLLKHTMVLETLAICSPGNPAEPAMEKVFHERLVTLPLGSGCCQIIFS